MENKPIILIILARIGKCPCFKTAFSLQIAPLVISSAIISSHFNTFSARRRQQCARYRRFHRFVAIPCSVCRFRRSSGEQTFPYKAFIAADEVYVRSGPGQNYYPTDKLAKGQEVEVYRHDPGGWCAIKPVGRQFFLDFQPICEDRGRQPRRDHRRQRFRPGGEQIQRRPRQRAGALA